VDSDKSAVSLRQILEQDTFDTMAIHLSLIHASNAYLSKMSNNKFDHKMNHFNARRVFLVTGYSLALVIVSLFTWRLVLVKLINGVTEFKNVLRILPSDLVLSSYPLKMFLYRTSKQVFEAVKHEM